MTLVLPAALEDEVVAHAREGAPREVVGVLAGELRGADDLRDRDSSDEQRAAPTRGGPPDADAAGEADPDASRVERVLRGENAAETPETRYEIAPAEELALLEAVDAAGLDVVGFYHSHPRGPPAPSPTDERLAAWPGRSYVVVSLAGPEPTVGSWRWTGETFGAERIVRD